MEDGAKELLETKPGSKITIQNKWIWITAGAALVVLLLVGLFGFLLPYLGAGSSVPESGRLVIQQPEIDSLFLSWPEVEKADYYLVEIYRPAAEKGEEAELLFSDTAQTAEDFLLPELPEGSTLTLRVRGAVKYQNLAGEYVRFSQPMEVTARFDPPEVSGFSWEADPNAKAVYVNAGLSSGVLLHYQIFDESDSLVEENTTSDGTLTIQFGDQNSYPVPQYGSYYRVPVSAWREEPGLLFQGRVTNEILITREHLLGSDLHPVLSETGTNTVTITWDETKGNGYEVQLLMDEGWNIVGTVSNNGERSYTSSRLLPWKTYQYRVAAPGWQAEEDSAYAAVSDTLTISFAETPIYATVWPIKELEAYSDAEMTEAVDSVKALEAYCVLEEKNGAFAVGINGKVCYIDSNYCMINLPEYLGELCSYSITNSVSSQYMIHAFAIPNVTGAVTAGYEAVRQEDGSYLVPLLYPTAQKLLTAAKNAAEQGYRLKIYDAYRPNVATRQIYDRTERILDAELPATTYYGGARSSVSLPSRETDEDGNLLPLTYGRVMLGDNHQLNHFLAQGGSLHNLGIALDLTLEDAQTGEELKMQTSMHDLSQYSVTGRNNEAARVLANIMTGAGFGALGTEWWHFQDNEIRWQLDLPFARNGISGEGWMKDAVGWRYRTVSGRYYSDETVTIQGMEYTFDEYGYIP